MKTFGPRHFLAAFVVAVGLPSACLADGSRPTPRAAVLDVLAGSALPAADLAGERGRGIVFSGAASSGLVAANNVGARTVTGTISNSNSINNNVGLTTVFQNSGNNSLLQSSTSIYINVH